MNRNKPREMAGDGVKYVPVIGDMQRPRGEGKPSRELKYIPGT